MAERPHSPENITLPVETDSQEGRDADRDLSEILALADFEGAETPEPAVLPTYFPPKPTSPALNQFLSYLVFSSHSARFAVELLCCLGIFAVLQEALPFVMASADWTSLTAWFLACLSVSLVDHFMLIPPFATFREACGEDAMGHHERAVELLDSIGPNSGHRVALPNERYQLTRAVFELHAGNAEAARESLEKAREAGLSGLSYMIYRLRISRLTEGQKCVAEELRVARALYPQSGTLAIEEALGVVESRTEFRKGMKIFGEAIALADETHPFGVSTRSLARAFNEVCRLWSGYAEDAIGKLSDEISVLAALCAANELARPLLSQLFLERAYYFATHAEPELARKDLRVGEILCRHSFPKSLATKVRSELAWRYPEHELPALA